MPSVRQVEKRIEEVEGFQVRFLSPDGTDPSRRRVDDYRYVNAANKALTVAKWRKSRFTRSYDDFGVEVLDGDGNPVHGKTLLSTVRDTYYEAEEEVTESSSAAASTGQSRALGKPAFQRERGSRTSDRESVEDENTLRKMASGTSSREAGLIRESAGVSATTTKALPKIDIYDIADRLWETADELRANSHLKSAEYSIPVLGLIFLKFSDTRFAQAEVELVGSSTGRREIGKANYQAKGILYLPTQSRFANLLLLKEGDNLGKAINDAMAAIEEENPALRGVLPRTYQSLTNDTLVSLLRSVNATLGNVEGDAFGKVYEYFLGKFAVAEGAKGGEYFTPTSIVRLIVGIIEPFHGKILDPACGSGGMFVQSARFVDEHRNGKAGRLSIYGQERVDETVRLCKMNLAVHGLEGQVSQSNTYYEDPFKSVGQFDYVMANPPFNVNKIDKSKLEGDRRFPFGMPKADNGNYIWIQVFYSTLNAKGRAGFVMANSAADAGGSELEIRKKLLAEKAVDVIAAVASNFFYTVTLPVTLWFLDRGKRGTEREDTVLFIDARKIFHQIDRAHRDWQSGQIEFLANIARLYRGEKIETAEGSKELMSASFPDGIYRDVAGLCGTATLTEVERQGWSLNPGRYVGVAEAQDDGADFRVRLRELNEELEQLNAEAAGLQKRVAANVAELLG
jgi:type I restriction enzyme M protein